MTCDWPKIASWVDFSKAWTQSLGEVWKSNLDDASDAKNKWHTPALSDLQNKNEMLFVLILLIRPVYKTYELTHTFMWPYKIIDQAAACSLWAIDIISVLITLKP